MITTSELSNYSGHLKSMFSVEREGGSLKSKQKWTGWGGSSLSVPFALLKKITRFFKQQTDFFLISCLAAAKSFSVLSLVQHIKVVFYWKGVDIFFFFHLLFFMSMWIFYCHCINYCVKNINVLSFESKKNSFLCFHSPSFHSKICKHSRTCFERGGNSIKWRYIDRGTCKRNRNEQGRRGSKSWIFERTYFLNDP